MGFLEVVIIQEGIEGRELLPESRPIMLGSWILGSGCLYPRRGDLSLHTLNTLLFAFPPFFKPLLDDAFFVWFYYTYH